ncbi:MAG: hypothetical protein NTV01_18810 [Bacteroidia bacterium]|nr:hypothetical protein [Bacteroidia bacterium]
MYGLRLGYQPQLVLLIGPKVLKKVNMALENGPECPQAWVEAGNKDWWMPEIFGGSRLEALTEYETAIRLMEKDSSFIRNNWYYLNVNMMLAGFYKQAGRTFSEREIYRKMIRFEPRFGWAKEKLRNL